jgi:gas vesicle protein
MNYLILQIDAMSMNFSLGDLVVLGGVLIPAVVGYSKLQTSSKSNKEAIEAVEKKLKEDILHITNSKRTQKKELTELIREKDSILQQRIDKTQTEMKDYITRSDDKSEKVNEKLNRILGLLEKNF